MILIEIFQLKDIRTSYAFQTWDIAKEQFRIGDYEMVSRTETQYLPLECIEEELSVDIETSDVVRITDGYGKHYYYCNDSGWIEISDFCAEIQEFVVHVHWDDGKSIDSFCWDEPIAITKDETLARELVDKIIATYPEGTCFGANKFYWGTFYHQIPVMEDENDIGDIIQKTFKYDDEEFEI